MSRATDLCKGSGLDVTNNVMTPLSKYSFNLSNAFNLFEYLKCDNAQSVAEGHNN